MSLKTRFGNLKNVLDEDSSQTEIITLDSPFVGNAQFEELTSNFNVDLAEVDCLKQFCSLRSSWWLIELVQNWRLNLKRTEDPLCG